MRREKVEKEKKIPAPANVPGGINPEITEEDFTKNPDAHKEAFGDMMKAGKEQKPGV